MIFGVWLLWDKAGSIEMAPETVSGANINALNTAPATLRSSVRGEFNPDDMTCVPGVTSANCQTTDGNSFLVRLLQAH
jgi:hypothetical protein